MYKELKKDPGQILHKLCEMKQVTLISGNICKDHVHMYVSISPKLSVSEFMGFLKEKSSYKFSVSIQSMTLSGKETFELEHTMLQQ